MKLDKHKRSRLPQGRARQTSRYRENEAKVHGVNACLALWRVRPKDIIKIYLTRERMGQFPELTRWCAIQHKAYKLVSAEELERLTESVHHEGICLIARESEELGFDAALTRLKKGPHTACVFYLDGVQNPHNVGNILRAAAHFDVALVLTDKTNFAVLPPSARRVSEGGSEYVPVVRCENPEKSLQALKAHDFSLVTTSSHATEDVFAAKIPARTVFILGSEVHGVSAKIEKLAQARIAIPGTGHVESLNVASAAAVLMAEHRRRFPIKTN